MEGGTLVCAETAARMLEVSVRTIQRMVSRGELPQPIKVGRLSRWPKADLLAWIESKRRPPRGL